MSIKVMAKIWETGPEKQSERFVLLALADFANDQGECWPSMQRLAEKTCMTERGAQKIVRRLEADGWLTIGTGGGRHGCNQYTINPEPCSPFQEVETPNEVHPERRSPPNVDAETPNKSAENPEHRSPEPSRITKEPSSKKKARMTSIPEDAVISETMLSIAEGEKISKAEALAQFEAFKGSAIAKGRMYANWDAAWRNWLRSPYFKPLTGGNYDNRTSASNRGNHPRASSPHDSLLAGFAAFANSDDDAEGRDFGGGYGPDDTGGETMDSRSGGYASQPVLRLIGAN